MRLSSILSGGPVNRKSPSTVLMAYNNTGHRILYVIQIIVYFWIEKLIGLPLDWCGSNRQLNMHYVYNNSICLLQSVISDGVFYSVIRYIFFSQNQETNIYYLKPSWLRTNVV